MRRAALIVAIVSALLFAGCTGGNAEPAGADPPPTSVIVGDDASGGKLIGTVTNDELLAQEGAIAGLKGIEQTVSSDANGQFTFENVPAGEHVLFVGELGFEQASKRITIIEGETLEVQITLTSVATNEPRHEMTPYKMFMACAEGLVVVTVSGGPCGAVLGSDKTTADHKDVQADLMTAIGELVWTGNSAFSAKAMRLTFGVNETGGSTPRFAHEYADQEGKSPLIVRADEEIGDFEGLGGTIRHRIWVPYDSPDPPIVVLVLQQSFDLYSTMFYGEPAPEGFTSIPDS